MKILLFLNFYYTSPGDFIKAPTPIPLMSQFFINNGLCKIFLIPDQKIILIVKLLYYIFKEILSTV